MKWQDVPETMAFVVLIALLLLFMSMVGVNHYRDVPPAKIKCIDSTRLCSEAG
jgi:hypothetical protein